eukprot:13310176-Alexandrium_andersonii.AAC.1
MPAGPPARRPRLAARELEGYRRPPEALLCRGHVRALGPLTPPRAPRVAVPRGPGGGLPPSFSGFRGASDARP